MSGRLAAAEAASVTLVSAPAGFGKTTALADWLGGADADRSATWLALDAGDNDPVVFWTYAIAAIRRAEPEVGAGALAALHLSPALTPVVAALLNDLDGVGRDVVLVLDDYHVIDSPDIHGSVAYLIDHAPPSFHLVIASRSDPPFPLSRLRARGQLAEIRAADLRFTPDETTSYLNDTMGLDLTAGEVAALGARTEGWIAALQLAALSLQGRADVARFVEDFRGDDRFVVDYLVEEVLDRQPPAIGSFLLHTSVLDRLNGGLCDALTGRVDGRATLEQLDRANLFVVALDDRRHWYRYHHLFADVLRARLVDLDPGRRDELHRRASKWYSAHGEPAAAIEHALAGRHVDDAARLIELAAPALRQERQEGTLRRWLEALPDEVFADRPVLAISLVGARMATGDTTGVERLLAQVESALNRSTPPPVAFDREMFARLPAQVLVQRAGLALLAGDLEATVAHASRALSLLDPDDNFRRASAGALLALAHWTAGDLEAAVLRYTAAVDGFIAADHLPDMLGVSLALADIQIALGRLTAAERTFDAGLRWTVERPDLRGAADMHAGLSEVLIERNRLDDAARHLETSRALGPSSGLPQHAYRWRVAMARLCRARGALDRALELIDEAAPLHDTDYSPPVRPVAAIRARVQLARGELESALGWATDRGLGADDELGYVREYEHITLARVLIARERAGRGTGALDAAIRLLDRLLVAAESGGRTGSAIEILVLRASALAIRGDTAAAHTTLDDAVRRAAPEGHVRVFLHAGPEATSLLRAVAARRDAVPHARRVLAAVDTTGASVDAPPAARARSVDGLSGRELDVLRLLRSDLSGPEIARALHVSMNTFRTHTKSIFAKLGARSRREAVRRATEIGL